MGWILATIVVLLFVIVPIALAFFAQWLAKEGILFMTVTEGTAKAIEYGGTFHHSAMSFVEHHLNDPRQKGMIRDGVALYRDDLPDWEVIFHGKGNRERYGTSTGTAGSYSGVEDKVFDRRPWWLKELGLYWVGLPFVASVKQYEFEWNETETDTDGSEKIRARDEITDFVYVSDFPYAFMTKDAETLDLLPTNLMTIATVTVCNPYRALYSGENWMQKTNAAIGPLAKSFAAGREYHSLVNLTGKTKATAAERTQAAREYSQPIIALTELLPDDAPTAVRKGLKERYGIIVQSADLLRVDLSGSAADLSQKNAAQAFAAEQAAKATVAKGRAEAQVIAMKGEQEANVIAMKGAKEAEALQKRLEVIRANGDAGLELAKLDALQTSATSGSPAVRTYVWADNPLKNLFGGNTPPNNNQNPQTGTAAGTTPPKNP